MKRAILLLKAICERLYFKFVEGRLTAELLGADETTHRGGDPPSEDPRNGTGLPIVGIFLRGNPSVRGGQNYSP